MLLKFRFLFLLIYSPIFLFRHHHKVPLRSVMNNGHCISLPLRSANTIKAFVHQIDAFCTHFCRVAKSQENAFHYAVERHISCKTLQVSFNHTLLINWRMYIYHYFSRVKRSYNPFPISIISILPLVRLVSFKIRANTFSILNHNIYRN